MKNNIQFAVVREDPEIESHVLSKIVNPQEVLLIASGGCTALTLRNRFPDTLFTLMEPNPAQIALIKEKVSELARNSTDRSMVFGIGQDKPDSLTNNGNFESLFRCFRHFLFEFVLPKQDWNKFFSESNVQHEIYQKIITVSYWPVAFDLFFSDSILMTMFGPAAIQHASPGSYPNYFRNVLEAGLKRDDAKSNYFLHHIFLGHYLKKTLPAYLTENPRGKEFKFFEGFADNIPSYKNFDLISLSNIFDWMEKDQVGVVVKKLASEMRSGSYVIYRQLNNSTDFQKLFGSQFNFDVVLSKNLFNKDRSLFYQSLHIGMRK